MHKMVAFVIEGIVQRLDHLWAGTGSNDGGGGRTSRRSRRLLLIGGVETGILIELRMEGILLLLLLLLMVVMRT
jgi:hypothetical protein